MGVRATPLKAALTGVELLLARCQMWQETAPSSLKLTDQVSRVAQLAARWRRAELASWRSLLAATAARHAAGASHMLPSVCLCLCKRLRVRVWVAAFACVFVQRVHLQPLEETRMGTWA